jgi:hypothetical protein
MTDEITVSKTKLIRECGLNEGWLQDLIENDLSILLLGDLEIVRREKRQSSGGRLDFLLQNPEDDSMCEVEVMLGETDESHIIRTIEYWDLERRRWPKRSHTAVLVAEHMNGRFFNVIQLLSLEIPIIAIQANIIEVDGKRGLHFTKILEVYQEPESQVLHPPETVDEKYWQEKWPWTLAHAKNFQEIFSRVFDDIKLNFNRHDTRLGHAGEDFIVLDKRAKGRSSFRIWLNNAEMAVATEVLDTEQIPYKVRPNGDNSDWQAIRLQVDQVFIQKNDNLFEEFAKLYQKSCQRT